MATPVPVPTACLPPVRYLENYTSSQLLEAINYLRTIYHPPVRGTRRIGQRSKCASGSSSTAERSALESIRADTYERAHAIRWLTGLVSNPERIRPDPEVTPCNHAEKVDALVRDAAALLALCAGTAGAGTLTRTFVFGQVHVELTDLPLDNGDFGTVGAQTWGSASLLAEILVETPIAVDPEGPGLRALELGAGTGLVSLTLAKLGLGKRAKIIASDFHEGVLQNLRRNVAANGVDVEVHTLDWSQFPMETLDRPFDEPFDLMLGADVVYEPEHAAWVKEVVSQLLRKPSNSAPRAATPVFHLVMPLRPTHIAESQAVRNLFPSHTNKTSATCHELCVLVEQVIVCAAGDEEGGGEVEYAHYQIGWR